MISTSTDTRTNRAAELPWDEHAGVEVRGLRQAITSQISEQKIPAEVAPMMAELLTRLDSFVEGAPRAAVAAPDFSGLGDSPTLHEVVHALGSAVAQLDLLITEQQESPKKSVLQATREVIVQHLSLRNEIAMRAQV